MGYLLDHGSRKWPGESVDSQPDTISTTSRDSMVEGTLRGWGVGSWAGHPIKSALSSCILLKPKSDCDTEDLRVAAGCTAPR